MKKPVRVINVIHIGDAFAMNSSNSRYINVMRQQKLIRRTHVI